MQPRKPLYLLALQSPILGSGLTTLVRTERCHYARQSIAGEHVYTCMNGMRIDEFSIRFIVFGDCPLRVINGLYLMWAIFGIKYSVRISAGAKDRGQGNHHRVPCPLFPWIWVSKTFGPCPRAQKVKANRVMWGFRRRESEAEDIHQKAKAPLRTETEVGFSHLRRTRTFTKDDGLVTDYSFKVNQVDNAFMPFRSILFPSQTANAIGTDIPALNWVSLASLVSSARFNTTRHVGPVYPPPLTDPEGSQTPFPMTS